MGVPSDRASEKKSHMDTRKRSYPYEERPPPAESKSRKADYSHMAPMPSFSQAPLPARNNVLCPSAEMALQARASHVTHAANQAHQNSVWGQFTSRENFALLHLV